MVWILNALCVLGCFFILAGTAQFVYHDLCTRYTVGTVEDKFDAGDDVVPGGPQYHVSYVNPKSGKKHTRVWIQLMLPDDAKAGDQVPVRYRTNEPEEKFDPGYRGFLEVNVRNIYVLGIGMLLAALVIRLGMVGRLFTLT